MILPVLALAVTVTFHPARPAVGDPITLEFTAPVTLDAPRDYEVVSREENRVVIRTFLPKPIVVGGVAGKTRFQNLIIPVRSVLRQGDDLKPAPLVPPREVAYPRLPFLAIAIAALCALAAWAAVWWKAKRAVEVEEKPDLRTPEERYREAVFALREDPSHPRRWAALADETRKYLAATRFIGTSLTTTELAPLLAERERAVVRDILRRGDIEKFAPPARRHVMLSEAKHLVDETLRFTQSDGGDDFDEVTTHALELAS